MTSSKDYWAARERAQQEANKKLDAKFDKELKKIYDTALINIRQEIDAFYGRYATKEGISLAEAKKRVSQADIKSYEAKAKEYVANRAFTEQANEEMRLYNLTMKVNRLEMLKSRIGMELAAKYSDMERKAAKHLQSGAEDEFKRMAGILGKYVPDVKKAASTIPGASFHNATYSERIWTNQRALKSEIDKLLQEGMIQGRNPRAIAPQLQRAFGVSKVASERLMRTEMCRVQIEAQRQSYDENGIDEFEYMAHAGCCEICAGMNGKVFKVKKMIVGDNAPPMHPNCRCGTVPHMGDEEIAEIRGGEKTGRKSEEIEPVTKANTGAAQKVALADGTVLEKRSEKYGFPDGAGGVKKMADAIIYKTAEGTEFVFLKKMDKKKQKLTIEQAVSNWNRVPTEIRKRAQKTIEVVDYYNPQDLYWRKRYKNFTYSYATGGDTITFYRHNYNHDDDYMIRTYCHEAGHYMDRQFGKTRRYSEGNEWT